MRQHVAHDIHGVDGKGAVLDADVDVHAKDQQALCQQLHLLEHALVARERRHRLLLPAAEGVRGRGGHRQPFLRGQADDKAALVGQFFLQLIQRVADRRAQLDHRLVQLRLEVALDHHDLVAFEKLRDKRAQLARLGVDDLVFLFNADRERGSLAHAVFSVSSARKSTTDLMLRPLFCHTFTCWSALEPRSSIV